ncbi:dihydroorotase [Agarilytica rhodophyticola]|uniref:dihydroorotase n=1 Tax=Agarilytica rhodophyticola TaxID=1737490 RepID=UPI000B343751|nr:dihydroorotase [Agarilytica rhodophyticola]
MAETITITAPDDWHIHLRDKESLKYTVPDAAMSFERAIVMPNLVPPVTNALHALAYRDRICQHIPEGVSFTPLMVLYLTDNTDAQTIADAKAAGVVACKLYPAGATTNSDSGVTDIAKISKALEAMEEHNMLLLVHGEVTDSHIDIFDREAAFIEQRMKGIIRSYPGLKVVFEHITTEDAVSFVAESGANIAATITAHHLMFNRNHMLVGGIRPHYYCLPVLKRNRHQQALVKAATQGGESFFLGTDSAPHAKSAKESACGCAGSYTAFAAMEMYAEVFDQADALDKLEAFASLNGPSFYGLEPNKTTITLEKTPWHVPESFDYLGEKLVPIKAGEMLNWQIVR